MTLAELNTLDRAEFVEVVGWIFEHSPWVAERAWAARPFAAGSSASRHGRSRWSGPRRKSNWRCCARIRISARARMSAASVGEQAGAGLDSLTAHEFERSIS